MLANPDWEGTLMTHADLLLQAPPTPSRSRNPKHWSVEEDVRPLLYQTGSSRSHRPISLAFGRRAPLDPSSIKRG